MKPLLIAHRGDSAHAPENTLPAFAQALAKGADWIELDLALSADGQAVTTTRVRALDGRANAKGDVPVCAPTGSGVSLVVGPKYQTLWYLITPSPSRQDD